MTVKLNIGYVATAITPYYSDEYKVREKSEASLKKLLADFDVNFIPFHKTIFSTEDSKEAEKFFMNKIDFLLLQTSSCSAGEQLYPLCNITDKIGVWAVPDLETEGDVKLHSLVSTSHYLAMIKKVLSDKKITTKWFYNYADTEEFKNKFSITVRSLVALKKMKYAKIGLVGGISPGFDNMKVDQSIIKKNSLKCVSFQTFRWLHDYNI